MEQFLEMFPQSGLTRKILLKICEEHHIQHIRDIVDIYRHKPDLFFEMEGFSESCWEEISEILSNPDNPYVPKDAVISFEKAKLIVKRNRLIDELTELSRKIQQIR